MKKKPLTKKEVARNIEALSIAQPKFFAGLENLDPKAWAKIKDDNLVASRELRKRDEAIFKEGIALFAEHYHSLWD